jgi:tRNA A37 methylthiotransferase MiaB
MKISFVQPNFQQGPKEFNAHYLPYSVGILWAYIQKFEHLKEAYELDHIIWRRDPLAETVEKLASNDVVAFSTYVWNKNYNYELARRIKEANPKCTLIFGGPEVPITKKDIFKRYPFMDFVVKTEGEVILRNLLEAKANETPYNSIKGLLINSNLGLVDTGESERIQGLDDIPSPYLTGVFDKLISETTDVEWNATLETNRGCPYACTFCDWGSLTYNKVKKYSLERVFAELEWMGKNKCGFVTITDANFGIFVERDNAIADKLLEVQNKYGYPSSFSITWAKDQKKEVFDIVFKLIKSPKFNQGLTVSVQSMDLEVLEHIKRKNLNQHNIQSIFALCDKHNVPVYTEVILGLPGETPTSWKKGVYNIIKAGNHTGINFLQAQLLENAEMNLLQKRLHKITSNHVYDYMSGSYRYDELEESVEVVNGTATMPSDAMIDCLLFNWFIQTFHVNGFTTYISRFLHDYCKLEYADFYDKLYEFLLSDEWFRQEQEEVKNYYHNWMTQGRIKHPKIGGIEVHGWNLVHRTTLNIHADRKYEHVFNLIEQFLMEHIELDATVAEQLFKFQKNYVVNYENIDQFPITDSFKYDFLGYLQDGTELEIPVQYKFDFVERKDMHLDTFLENIYFSRKRNFGKSLITYHHSL